MRELNHRVGDGLSVQLLWDDEADITMIRVEDYRSGAVTSYPIDPGKAARAFIQPFAYMPDRATGEVKVTA